MTDTRVDRVLADLIDHPGWDEILHYVRKSIQTHRSSQQSVLEAKSIDSVVYKSIRAAAEIESLRTFVRNVYQSAEVPIPPKVTALLRE